jgi:hypothetical protein
MGISRPVVFLAIIAPVMACSSTRIQTDFDRTMTRILQSFPPP